MSRGMKRSKPSAFIRKNWLNILMAGFILLMFLNPDAKVWVLQQIAKTGLFNPRIKEQNPSETAKAYAFTNPEGKTINHQLNKGKVVLINYWASWCPPCRAEMPSFLKLYQKFKQNPSVVFLFVSEDEDRQQAVDYFKNNNLDLPLYFQTSAGLNELTASTLPTTYILNKEGKPVFGKSGMGNYASKSFMEQLEKLAAGE